MKQRPHIYAATYLVEHLCFSLLQTGLNIHNAFFCNFHQSYINKPLLPVTILSFEVSSTMDNVHADDLEKSGNCCLNAKKISYKH